MSLCAVPRVAAAFPKGDAEVDLIIKRCDELRDKGAEATTIGSLGDAYTSGPDSAVVAAIAEIEKLETGEHVVAAKSNWMIDLQSFVFVTSFATATVKPADDPVQVAELRLVADELGKRKNGAIKAQEWNLLLLRALLVLDHDSIDVNLASGGRPSVVVGNLLQTFYRNKILANEKDKPVSQEDFALGLLQAMPDTAPDDASPEEKLWWADFIAPFRRLVFNEVAGACGVAALGGELSLYALNRAVAQRVYPIGISFTPVVADNVFFGPLQFFVHDVTHSTTAETDFHVAGPGTSGPKYAAVKIARCRAFVDENKDDLEVQLVMFVLLHENPFILVTKWADLVQEIAAAKDLFLSDKHYGKVVKDKLLGDNQTLAGDGWQRVLTAQAHTLEQLKTFQASNDPSTWCLPLL